MKAEIFCDTCKEKTEHRMIKETLYRCMRCGTHTTVFPEKEVEIKAILSRDSETRVGSVRIPDREELVKGEEIIVDIENESRIGKITAIQLKDGRISEFGIAKDTSAVWLKEVGEVYVKFSLHKRSVTTSRKLLFDGETEFKVGERISVDGKNFTITRIKLNDGRILRKEGEKAIVKDIKRVYATYTP
ncbi:MAG: HVO_0476 family zinc finger protein [Archaeoglobaceae archaeon]